MSDYLPPYMREAEEWEIIGFCPNCEISMMFFDINNEHSWECGRVCPNCQFVHEPYGGNYGEWRDDGKLLEIKMFHGVSREGKMWR